MTDKKASQNPDFLAMLATLTQDRTDLVAAGLLGVPVHTLRKWTNGTRAPSAAAVRLVTVLATMAVMAPALLDALTPAPVSTSSTTE
jgi:predicted transporter